MENALYIANQVQERLNTLSESQTELDVTTINDLFSLAIDNVICYLNDHYDLYKDDLQLRLYLKNKFNNTRSYFEPLKPEILFEYFISTFLEIQNEDACNYKPIIEMYRKYYNQDEYSPNAESSFLKNVFQKFRTKEKELYESLLDHHIFKVQESAQRYEPKYFINEKFAEEILYLMHNYKRKDNMLKNYEFYTKFFKELVSRSPFPHITVFNIEKKCNFRLELTFIRDCLQCYPYSMAIYLGKTLPCLLYSNPFFRSITYDFLRSNASSNDIPYDIFYSIPYITDSFFNLLKQFRSQTKMSNQQFIDSLEYIVSSYAHCYQNKYSDLCSEIYTGITLSRFTQNKNRTKKIIDTVIDIYQTGLSYKQQVFENSSPTNFSIYDDSYFQYAADKIYNNRISILQIPFERKLNEIIEVRLRPLLD